MSTIISPRLLASLGAFYPSLCDVQEATGAAHDDYGQPLPVWLDKPGHTDIPCRISPDIKGREVKGADQTVAIASHRIALAGSYPAVTPAMRVVSGAQVFDILAVESDGSGATTSLVCQIVTG